MAAVRPVHVAASRTPTTITESTSAYSTNVWPFSSLALSDQRGRPSVETIEH